MNAASPSSVLAERLPVWETLSEFFLDTELDDTDYGRIAGVLASSPYSIRKTEEILRYEVYPVLIWNLRSVAGVWAGFDREWLAEAIKPRLNRRPMIRLPLLQWSMVGDHWERVSERMRHERGTKPNPE